MGSVGLGGGGGAYTGPEGVAGFLADDTAVTDEEPEDGEKEEGYRYGENENQYRAHRSAKPNLLNNAARVGAEIDVGAYGSSARCQICFPMNGGGVI